MKAAGAGLTTRSSELGCPGGPDFVTVLLGLAGLLTTENTGAGQWGGLPAALSLELAQNQYFNRVVHLPALLGRYQRIWRELPAELDEADWTSPLCSRNLRAWPPTTCC